MASSASGKYLDGLPTVERDRYIRKLKCLHGGPGVDKYEDPYEIKEELWIDDVSKWPSVEFPALYVYFIETPGGYTRESLKAYKSLEAYNYYSRLMLATGIYDSYIYDNFFTVVAGCVQFTFMLLRIKSIVF